MRSLIVPFLFVLLQHCGANNDVSTKRSPASAEIDQNSGEAGSDDATIPCAQDQTALNRCPHKIPEQKQQDQSLDPSIDQDQDQDADPNNNNDDPIEPAKPDWSNKWRITDGKIITPQGSVWRGSGTNLANLIDKDDSFVRQAMERAKRDGFTWIRLWACDHNSSGPKDMAERARKTKHLVELAAEQGLKSMIVLTDEYSGLDGSERPLDIRWFTEKKYNEQFVPWLKEIIPLLKDSPDVFAWQLVNEGRAYDQADIYLNFFQEMTAIIRSYDDLHLITPGALSLWHTAHASAYEKNLGLLAEKFRAIDARMFWSNSFYNFETPAQADFATLQALKIPLIVTEYGFCQSSASGNLRPKQHFLDPTWGVTTLFNVYQASGLAAWQADEVDCGYANPRYPDFNIRDEWFQFNSSYSF